MDFFKSLFGKGKQFVPTPTQNVPGLEPIVVQAIENLYPNEEDQKKVFEYSLKYHQVSKAVKKVQTLALLSLLCYSNGKTEKLVDLDSPDLSQVVYYIMVDTTCGFSIMKSAEKWVKSITKS